jgi:hypothetical protein
MTFIEHPRLLARVGGVLYLTIGVLAIFTEFFVRGQLLVPGDMAQTTSNILAHERLWRVGFTTHLLVALCNLPLGLIFYELLKVVNRPLALLALLFISASAILEAISLLNHFGPLLMLTLPEYATAFEPAQRLALVRGSLRLFAAGWNVALTFFGTFCILTGYLLFRSRFFPAVLGVMLAIGGASYLVGSLTAFLALPSTPYLLLPCLVAEMSLALWLLVVGVNETKWRAQVGALARSSAARSGSPLPLESGHSSLPGSG